MNVWSGHFIVVALSSQEAQYHKMPETLWGQGGQ